MVTKLFFRPQFFPTKFLFPAFLVVNSKPTYLSLSIVAAVSSCSIQAQQTDPSAISYGPSLHQRTNPCHRSAIAIDQNPRPNQQSEENDPLFDKESFTRVFDVSALRVPSMDCFTLENRLRGHLLNWPRIRNIARVPGDELDPEIAQLFEDTNAPSEGEGQDSLVSLRRRIYGKDERDGEVLSPVLYRDKLVKTFNSCGFMKFRSLSRMTRPKKKKKKEDGEGEKDLKNKGAGKSNYAVAEVVEDGEEEEGMENWIGEEFWRKKWRGSTRLLLLDQEHAGKGVDELPEAIKVAVPILW